MTSERMKNLYEVMRFSMETTHIIPRQVFFERNTEFKKQQEAYENLKKDPKLAITELEMPETDSNGELIGCYKIIKIRMKQDSEGD